jgi:pterin-4a-carbinolamine dehydratase
MNTQNAVDPKAGRDTVPRHPEEDLKSERVQDALTADPAGGFWSGDIFAPPLDPGSLHARLKSERVQEELKAMIGWAATEEETAIENVKTFATPEIAGLYAGFVAQSAAATGYPVTVSITGNQVCVTVFAQEVDGCLGELTLPVLAFARQL